MNTVTRQVIFAFNVVAFQWHRRVWPALLLSALSVGLLLHADALVRHFYTSQDKVGVLISGPRTDVGDNYAYVTLSRHALERISASEASSGDPDGGDHRNINSISNSYSMALYASHGIYLTAKFLTATSRDALLFASILHTALFAVSFLVFILVLLKVSVRGRRPPILVVTFVGLVFIDAFGNSSYSGAPYWADNLLTYSSNPTRFVNPNLFWAVGLAASTLVVRWLQFKKHSVYFGAVLLALLTGMFSISVGATLALALGLTAAFSTITNRVAPWRLLGIALASVAGVAWSYLQLRSYALSSLGQELRHGEFLGLVVKWQFLLLLGLVPIIWRVLGNERVFISATIVSAMLIGMFCDSFNLGSRLWLRGAVVYAWAATVFLALRISFDWLRTNRIGLRMKWWWQLPSIALMAVFVLRAQQLDVDSWKGFMERDKWELLDWIDKKLPINSIVASEDIDDAFFLPIYTHVKPLYAMYGLTNRSRDEELRRYFYNMRLFGRDQQLLSAILNLNQTDSQRYFAHVMSDRPAAFPYRGDIADALIFLELVAYYSFGSGVPNALSDAQQHKQLEVWLKNRDKEASILNFAVDFIIVDNAKPAQIKFSNWLPVYRNNRYSIMKNPLDRINTGPSVSPP
jgi:hypothetical protein